MEANHKDLSRVTELDQIQKSISLSDSCDPQPMNDNHLDNQSISPIDLSQDNSYISSYDSEADQRFSTGNSLVSTFHSEELRDLREGQLQYDPDLDRYVSHEEMKRMQAEIDQEIQRFEAELRKDNPTNDE